MIVGIVGLGLIGGSFAKAFHESENVTVLGFDSDQTILSFAEISGVINGILDKKTISTCDLVLIAIRPEAAIAYLTEMAPFIGQKPIVIDCCGTKRVVCTACFPLAKTYGFTYVGGHPMAGTHNSGFKYARANLFHNAPMVIVPPTFDDIDLLTRIKALLAPVGFGKFSITTAEKHDEMIAFTSQMAHLVSNAYIKSPTAGTHKGFSAGSYKDLTRVAWLDPQMWSELFLENKDYLLHELEIFIDNLQKYREALINDDQETLVTLLEEGRQRKKEVDGR